MGKTEIVPDLIINDNLNTSEKRLKNSSKRKVPLKPVEVPNLLKGTKIYETSSNLINNSKKDATISTNSNIIPNVKENPSSKKIIFNKNNTPIIIDKISSQKNSFNNNPSNSNINEIQNNNLYNIKNITQEAKDNSTKLNDDSNSNIIFNNSDYNSSRSSWKFDKNLLDDSAFRKVNIKKEKLEINCEKENLENQKNEFDLIKKNEINDNNFHDSLLNDKFIAFSSAYNNKINNQIQNKNETVKLNHLLNSNNSNSDINNFSVPNDYSTNNISNINNYNENTSSHKNTIINSKIDTIKIREESIVESDSINSEIKDHSKTEKLKEKDFENLKNNLIKNNNSNVDNIKSNSLNIQNNSNNNTNKIIANLDKYGFVSKNNINFTNLENNKNILENNNLIMNKNTNNIPNTLSKNTYSNTNSNVNTTINQSNNPYIKKASNNKNNSQIKQVKKPESKMSKSLSSFKFEFDEEDPLNSSTCSNFKIAENEEVFNKIVNHHILLEFHEVHDFLESLNLEKYLDHFLKKGLENLDKLIEGN